MDSSAARAPSDPRRVGVLIGLGPVAYWLVALSGYHPPTDSLLPGPANGALPGFLILLGGAAMRSLPRSGRAIASAGMAGLLTLTFPLLQDRLITLFLLLLGTLLLLYWLWTPGGTSARVSLPPAAAGIWASVVALVGFLIAIDTGFVLPADRAVLLAGPAFALLLVGDPRRHPEGAWRLPPRLLGSLAALAAFIGLLWGGPLAGATAGFLTANVAVVCALREAPLARAREGSRWDPLLDQPARLLVTTFLVTCLVGGLILSLAPSAPSPDRSVAPIDALFTAVSATCVTGLIVVDTPNAFSSFGQAVILLLIQVGGLGIMTFSTAAMLVLRRRLSVRAEGAMSEIMGSGGRGELALSLRRVLVVTALSEAAGAMILGVLFLASGDTPGAALWRGVFTSVSAFCNAGFALQTDNLIPYANHPFLLLVVSLLIIVGGLGPAVIVELPNLFRRRRVSLHAKMVASTTAVLLVLPTLVILYLESPLTMEGFALEDRIAGAWFQSVTTRTAGFNSVDIAATHTATKVLMDLLMFVGGSPGSTAGGIKTTTAMLIGLSVLSTLRGRDVTTAFRWRIPASTVHRAFAVFFLGLLVNLAALMALLLTQRLTMESALFEVLSATGTVGLSIGATAALDGIGKAIIILCMFAGRVGPVTLALALHTDDRADRWVYPQQEVPVG